MAIHTLAVLVENSPGVLARVASLFSRRGYNIDSLAVGPTENPKVSRMTIVLNLEGHALDQVSAQLFKLVNVIGISEMKDSDSLKREILLVKVANTAAAKAVVNKYKAVIADEGGKTISIEAVGQSSAITAPCFFTTSLAAAVFATLTNKISRFNESESFISEIPITFTNLNNCALT